MISGLIEKKMNRRCYRRYVMEDVIGDGRDNI